MGAMPRTGELLRGQATGCSACQRDTAFPKQCKSSPWHPASRLCEQTQKKSPPAARRQAPWWQLASSCPHPSIGSFSRILPGRHWVPLPGPTERKPGKCRRRQPAPGPASPGDCNARLCGSCWGRSKPGMASEPPKDFLSHLHPRRLLFPESELHAFRKALLTCEITFRTGDIPAGRVILWLEKGNVATNGLPWRHLQWRPPQRCLSFPQGKSQLNPMCGQFLGRAQKLPYI